MKDIKNKGNRKKVILLIICIIIIIATLIYIIFANKTNSSSVNKDNKAKELTWNIDKGLDNNACTTTAVIIYEDENYIYTVGNECEANYKIVYSNNESYTLGEALKKSKVAVEELRIKGVNIQKKSRTQNWVIEESSENMTCMDVLDEIHDDKGNSYNVPNPCYADAVYVVYSNGERLTIREALSQGKVTADELRNNGVRLY